MDVVGHQAPRPDFHIGRVAFPAEQVAIARVVVGAEERLLPAVAALGDVVRHIGYDDPGEAGHGRSVADRSAAVN